MEDLMARSLFHMGLSAGPSHKAERENGKDTHENIKSLRELLLGPMGQVKEGACRIPQLHRHRMPEWKRADALRALDQIEVQNRCEPTGHERHKSEDPINRQSASDEHHPPCLQPWRNGVRAAELLHNRG